MKKVIITEGQYRLFESEVSEGNLKRSQTILRAANISEEDIVDIMNQLKQYDVSSNQKNLPFMAMIVAWDRKDITSVESVFNDYEELQKKNRIKPMQLVKGSISIGGETFKNFLNFAEYIHGEKNKYAEKRADVSQEEYAAEDIPIFSSNNIDVYEAHNVGKCIKYSRGSLTGRGYVFCIGAPGNTMYQSYRDSKISTFYFIVDRNKFVTNEEGLVNLDDPLHMVVYDVTRYGIELTDANNMTGTIAEFGKDVKGYQEYLKSKGIPLERMQNKPKSPEEEAEQSLLGSRNTNLGWFKKLSYDYKSKYIGRGHLLTDEQFNYLLR
jgi:hypothetical protein